MKNKERNVEKGIFDYFFKIILILIVVLVVFSIGFVLYSKFFGLPCWAFNGVMVNNSIGLEIIERCGIK